MTTVPANGDVNPYGVAFVPLGFPSGGAINPGDILVSNFNNSANQQGTGTTIVDISPSGSQSVFFQDPSTPGQLGLTTALGVLSSGFVIVGSVPATYDSDGNLCSVGQGSLLILDSNGNVVTTLSDPELLDGPWDLTVNDQGSSRPGVRLQRPERRGDSDRPAIPRGSGDPVVQSMTEIASGYLTRTDPAALVVGPTGLAYNAKTEHALRRLDGRQCDLRDPERSDPHEQLGQRETGLSRMTRTCADRSDWCWRPMAI